MRNKRIDLIRFIGILLMVIGHSSSNNYVIKIIYLFHMPLFFIVSGYCYNMKYNHNFKMFFVNKIKTLYIPYVISNILFALFHNTFIKMSIYTDNKLFLNIDEGNQYGLMYSYSFLNLVIKMIKIAVFVGGEQLGGANWFLRVLFFSTSLFCFVQCIIEKLYYKFKTGFDIFVLIVIVFVGYFLSYTNSLQIANISAICPAYFCIWLGYNFQKVQIHQRINTTILKDWIVIILSTALLLYQSKFDYVSIAMNHVGNPIFFISVSISGYFLIYSISDLFYRISEGNVLSKLLEKLVYFGENSIWIVCLHFLAFKLVSFLFILINNYPIYYLASFPIIYHKDYYSWSFYTLAGLVVPILLCKFYKKMKRIVVRQII